MNDKLYERVRFIHYALEAMIASEEDDINVIIDDDEDDVFPEMNLEVD